MSKPCVYNWDILLKISILIRVKVWRLINNYHFFIIGTHVAWIFYKSEEGTNKQLAASQFRNKTKKLLKTFESRSFCQQVRIISQLCNFLIFLCKRTVSSFSFLPLTLIAPLLHKFTILKVNSLHFLIIIIIIIAN